MSFHHDGGRKLSDIAGQKAGEDASSMIRPDLLRLGSRDWRGLRVPEASLASCEEAAFRRRVFVATGTSG